MDKNVEHLVRSRFPVQRFDTYDLIRLEYWCGMIDDVTVPTDSFALGKGPLPKQKEPCARCFERKQKIQPFIDRS